MMDPAGTILEGNERFAEIVGMPRDEIIGLRPPFPWWLPDGPQRTRGEAALTPVLAGGSGGVRADAGRGSPPIGDGWRLRRVRLHLPATQRRDGRRDPQRERGRRFRR